MSLAARLSVVVLGTLYPMLAFASEESTRPLHFDEVFRSVQAHDPRIRQAVERLRKAEFETMAEGDIRSRPSRRPAARSGWVVRSGGS